MMRRVMHFPATAAFSRTIIPSSTLLYRHACTQLFIGGLSYDTNEAVLKDAFGQHGEIVEVTVKVMCHPVSGRSKGYGFVKFTTETAAATALKEINGQLLDGRNIRVEYAQRASTELRRA